MHVTPIAAPAVMQGSRSLVGFFKSVIDPLLVTVTLFACTLTYSDRIRGPEVLLAALVFSLTYPGTIPFRYRKQGLAREILGTWLLILGLLFSFGYATGYLDAFDRDVLVAWSVSTPFVLYATHLISPWFVPRLVALQGVQSCVIVGANDIGKRLARVINNDDVGHSKVVAFFDDRTLERIGGVQEAPLAGNLSQLASWVQANRVNTLYIALPMASHPRILKLLDDLRDTTASIYFAPDIFVYDLIQARMEVVGGIPLVALCESPFQGTTGVVKRLADLTLASLAIVLTAPVMLAVALGVKLSSPGPILFKQRRYGLDGHEIQVWKFRSMRVMEDGGEVRQATQSDARITPFGRFIRRTSLDELPQFFNVLQGRMSVVGPRPHAVAHNEQYRKLIKGYMIRHKVKPGITGLAQINGARGETETLEEMAQRIDYDLTYLRNWSLKLDLQIVAKTALMVLRGDPKAY
jgi:putative colanic acid biosynthesis UDP-glucose lipid carrier transferase